MKNITLNSLVRRDGPPTLDSAVGDSLKPGSGISPGGFPRDPPGQLQLTLLDSKTCGRVLSGTPYCAPLW